jgi:hypothetical protein
MHAILDCVVLLCLLALEVLVTLAILAPRWMLRQLARLVRKVVPSRSQALAPHPRRRQRGAAGAS